jgi:uncharacterized lipoprotein
MKLGWIAPVCVGLVLSGCQSGASTACHSKSEYQKATEAAPLQVPEGMDSPDMRGRLEIPEGEVGNKPVPRSEPCLDIPPDYFRKPEAGENP